MASSNRRPSGRKAELTAELLKLGRDMGTAGLMFHQAIADRLGLNTTDHKCLDLLRGRDEATAGDLAEWTGLTTGAVTGIIDRLERAGFVRREAHPTDRRKIVIRAIPERLAEVGQLFQPLAEGVSRIGESYSEAQVQVITDYMTRMSGLFRELTQRLRDGEPDSK